MPYTKLDEHGTYSVLLNSGYLDGEHLVHFAELIQEHNGLVRITVIPPKQALSLLAWLEANREQLEQYAKEEQ